jgi:hypothetical protein
MKRVQTIDDLFSSPDWEGIEQNFNFEVNFSDEEFDKLFKDWIL